MQPLGLVDCVCKVCINGGFNNNIVIRPVTIGVSIICPQQYRSRGLKLS